MFARLGSNRDIRLPEIRPASFEALGCRSTKPHLTAGLARQRTRRAVMRGRMRASRSFKLLVAGWVVAAAVQMVAAPPAQAGNLEPNGLNLGLTSFFDGFGRSEEGFAYLGYAFY